MYAKWDIYMGFPDDWTKSLDVFLPDRDCIC